MDVLINAFPLYNFLKYCNNNKNEKIVLDCGAGGSNPPLTLFYKFGYKTYGIEICKDALKKANTFATKNNMDLNIKLGDMKNIPFNNELFSFVFSYNTSVHMKKEEFLIALSEFYRVLKKDGLCYINVLSEECDSYRQGINNANGEVTQIEDGEKVLYCHYKDNEIEKHLKNFQIIYKEKRIVTRIIDDKEQTSGYIDYILKVIKK